MTEPNLAPPPERLLSERLRTAAEAGAPTRRGPELASVRRRGHRRRTVRAGLGAATALAVTAGIGLGVAQLPGPPTGAPTVAAPETAAPTSSGYPSPQPLPATGIITAADRFNGHDLIFWLKWDRGLLLFAVGRHAGDGTLEATDVQQRGPVGAPLDRAFEGNWALCDGPDQLLSGYVIGPGVTSVTLDVDGATVTPATAQWAGDPSIHVWWLVLPGAGGASPRSVRVANMVARDATGAVVADQRSTGEDFVVR